MKKYITSGKKCTAIVLMAIALMFISCKSEVIETPKRHVSAAKHVVKSEEVDKIQEAIDKEDCTNYKGPYDFARFEGAADVNIRIHELRCAYKEVHKDGILAIKDPNEADKNLLNAAAKVGDLESVKLLMNIVGLDVNIKDNNNGTSLFYATDYGFLDVVKYLGEHGSEIDTVRVFDKFTPLIIAATHGYVDILKYLVSKGAKVTAVDINNKTACDYAKGKPNEAEMTKAMNNCQ